MSLKKNLLSKSYKVRVGITMGDPSGIGPSIITQALRLLKNFSAEFVVIGDRRVFNKVQSPALKTPSFKFIDLKNVNHKNFAFGKVKAEYGRASIEYLDKALELIRKKEIDCLVTCPISKEAINLAGYKYSGHTEYFSQRTKNNDCVMMLLNKFFKFSLVTRHLPLAEVSRHINESVLYKTIILTAQALKEWFEVINPRLAVCALNPHASDNGVIGDEENKIIKPVLKKIKKDLCSIFGPLPCDTAISQAQEKKYDALIAMYHDQALIPLKLTHKSSGVNLTLGLPFVRTSPLHGTAFDIAATGRPDASSLIEAIKLCLRCTLNQRKA